MVTNTGIIKIALKMKDDGTIKVLRSTGSESEKTGKKGKKAFDKMDKSSRSFTKSVGGASTAMMKMAAGAAGILGLAVAWNKLKTATKEYVNLASVQEEAETDLAAVLRATGNASGYNIIQLKAMASAMQKVTRYGDEAILSGMSILATFKQIRGEGFEKATMAALNLSQTMKQDLKSSMVQLGKALNDPITGLTALTRVGITFKDSQKDMITTLQESGDIMGAQSVILAELESQFGGSATVAIEIFSGRMDQAKNALGDTKEEMGFLITKNQFFIESAQMATGEFERWGDAIKNNRVYLMQLAKDGFLKFVGSVEIAIEAIEFFHMSWKGLQIAGHLALSGLGAGLQKLYPMMRMMVQPVDAIFKGLEKLGMLDVNPFDSIATGLDDFKWSSAEVLQNVIADTNKSVERYDAVKNSIQGWKNKIAEIPVAYVDANDEIVSSTKSSVNTTGKLHEGLSKKAIAEQKKTVRAVQADLDKFFSEIEAHEKKIIDVNQKFATEYKRVTMSSYDFERDQLRVRYENEFNLVNDKIKLAKWYELEKKRIDDEEILAAKEAAQKIADANKSMGQQIFEATRDWSKSAVSQLNEMVWGAEESFGDIAVSFGKMLTEMELQKAASSVMDWMGSESSSGSSSGGGGWMSWISSFFNAHGNAFDKSGVKAYAHGAAFTNKIVDQPTMFAHGGGFGVMGEKGPEVIAPLFRASNGDMGVKTNGGGGTQVDIKIEVIDKTGSEIKVTKQEPRFDSGAWITTLVLEKIVNNRSYKGSFNAALGRT